MNAQIPQSPTAESHRGALQTSAIHGAMHYIQTHLSRAGIAKDEFNAQQKFKYRGIDDVYNALGPLLSEAKVFVVPMVLTRSQTERTSASGNALFSVVVEMEFRFVSAEDGSFITVRTFGEAMDSGDKATNKAMAVAFKYACLMTFCVPTEGDNDPDGTVHTVKPREPGDDDLDEYAKTFTGANDISRHERTGGSWRDDPISENQRKRLYAISQSKGWKKEEIAHLLSSYGFAHSTEITRGKYDEICKRIEEGALL